MKAWKGKCFILFSVATDWTRDLQKTPLADMSRFHMSEYFQLKSNSIWRSILHHGTRIRAAGKSPQPSRKMTMSEESEQWSMWSNCFTIFKRTKVSLSLSFSENGKFKGVILNRFPPLLIFAPLCTLSEIPTLQNMMLVNTCSLPSYLMGVSNQVCR